MVIMKMFIIDEENEIYGNIKDSPNGSKEDRSRLLIRSPIFDPHQRGSNITIRIIGKKSMRTLRDAINKYLGEESKK